MLKKAAILGAGYMGSAITFPLADNGIKINLWGTWLDDAIIDSCRKEYHPKLVYMGFFTTQASQLLL